MVKGLFQSEVHIVYYIELVTYQHVPGTKIADLG